MLRKSIPIFFVFGILLLASCNSASRLYKKGVQQMRAGKYQPAIDNFTKAKAKNASFKPLEINTSIASAYWYSNRIKEAEPFYKDAIAAGNKDDTVKYYYAYALKANGKYKEAQAAFEDYMKTAKSLRLRALAKKEIENLPEIEKTASQKTFYEIQNVQALNTTASEFSPVLQGENIIFTASRKEKAYEANGLGMVGLYKSKLADSTSLQKPELFSDKIYDANVNEGTPTFSKDGKMMIFARGNLGGRTRGRKDMDLYISYFRDNKWTDPELMPISHPDAWDAQPTLSTDGKTLYFASNRSGGLGGVDLWRATADASGRFGKPTNMGTKINTPGNDMFPYVSDDGKLYFSSDGHPGLGRLDMFVAIRKAGEITLSNMGVPMNSTGDDFGIIFKTPTTGYFSSDREGGKGDDDIYYFEDKNPGYKIVNYFLAGTTITKGPTGDVVLGNTKIQFMEGDKQIGEMTTKDDGTFKFPVQEGKNYMIIAAKPDYLTNREPFSMSGRTIPQEMLIKPVTDTTFYVKVPLNREEKGVTLVLNIYYDLDKDAIRPDAAIELDKVVQFLNDNPRISVELGSHTDARASDDYNLALSQRRANSAVQYLISKGIAVNRIAAKGYGETALLIKEAETEEEHQQNRRTEIRVTGVNK
ncbi:OmpA family protein [Cytophagaceae bacterium DM2B3-1]|uniref:OmpA family protein n=1 Tax=Xanthocytophaga flava TaxID=3048013 RepID=A0ABT7CRX7_9BACT|nr:OmpA family protein [Xanthocytophaga flavus]MDJ1471748.1 OmpA family protein [Xanthocytophaga flavus]MDJ1496503.1 OmpA family protein [Xanthocytophaga flavus]